MQHEVLSSYLSGLVVLAGLFFIYPLILLLFELGCQELPVAVRDNPAVASTIRKGGLRDIKVGNTIGILDEFKDVIEHLERWWN